MPPTCIGGVKKITYAPKWEAYVVLDLLCRVCWLKAGYDPSFLRKKVRLWVPTLKIVRFMCYDCGTQIWACTIDRRYFSMRYYDDEKNRRQP